MYAYETIKHNNIVSNFTNFNISNSSIMSSVTSTSSGMAVMSSYEECARLAREGDLEGLKTARLNGSTWDVTTSAAAALGGHLND